MLVKLESLSLLEESGDCTYRPVWYVVSREGIVRLFVSRRFESPAGSTAYNLSASGPILPLDSDLLALTPISAFRPRRWRGAILPDRYTIAFTVKEPAKRPVSAVADQKEVRDVAEVRVRVAQDRRLTLLFDPGHSLDERMIAEQFAV